MMLLGISGLGDSPTCGYLTCYEDCSASCPSGQTAYLAPDGTSICKPQCPSGQCYDQNGNCAKNSEVVASGGSSSGSSGSSWTDSLLNAGKSLLQSFGVGVVSGITNGNTATTAMKTCSNGQVVPVTMACPVPWYQTTPGIIGIVLGVGSIAYYLTRSKTPTAKAA